MLPHVTAHVTLSVVYILLHISTCYYMLLLLFIKYMYITLLKVAVTCSNMLKYTIKYIVHLQ